MRPRRSSERESRRPAAVPKPRPPAASAPPRPSAAAVIVRPAPAAVSRLRRGPPERPSMACAASRNSLVASRYLSITPATPSMPEAPAPAPTQARAASAHRSSSRSALSSKSRRSLSELGPMATDSPTAHSGRNPWLAWSSSVLRVTDATDASPDLAWRAEAERFVAGAMKDDERGGAPHRRDPQCDRVIDDGRGGGDRRRDSVEHEHAHQTAVQDPDPAGNRDHVREVADLVGHHNHRQRGRVAGGRKTGGQHRDVAPQKCDRADDAPVGRKQDPLGEADARGQLEQHRAKGPLRSALRDRG